jgi:hypothetical protein
MGKLVTDFVDDLPCSEKKVALDVVAVHVTTGTRGRPRVDAATLVESAGVREPIEDPNIYSRCATTDSI